MRRRGRIEYPTVERLTGYRRYDPLSKAADHVP
jgi:hypothetical protein